MGQIVPSNEVEIVSGWLARCRELEVVVFGDLFVERALIGRMTGVAAEGPIPVVQVERTEHELAAAGYAAAIAAAFGARAHLVSAVGEDEAGQAGLAALSRAGVNIDAMVRDARLTTNWRTRVIAAAQHKPPQEVLHLQMVNDGPALPAQVLAQLLDNLRAALRRSDVLLVVEQGAGLVSPEWLLTLRNEARRAGVPIIGDLQNVGALASGFDALVLNDDELARCLSNAGGDLLDVQAAAKELLKQTGSGCLLVTRGPRPALLARGDSIQWLPVEAVPVYDVTGAGEAVSAGLTLGFGAGLEPGTAAQVALQVGSLSVTRPGRAVISAEEFRRYVLGKAGAVQARKIVSVEELRQIVREARGRGQRIVWTNGCFDLLHVGHILYLEKAKSLGDILVVGLNSDASVRATKGPNRPIVNEAQRARLLASLECTDYVVIFDAPSPKEIIAELKPDVYVKGGDYTIDTINQEERRIVEGYGGEIALLPGVEGMSTTELIRRVLAAYGKEGSSEEDQERD